MKNLSPRAPVIKVTPPGPKARQILARDKRWASKSYSQQVPVVWESAQDCIVTDVDGNRYIDLTSGIVVTNTGHGHPSVVAAIQEQSARLLACYDAVHENRVRLQEELARLMPDGDWRILLLSSGSEAVEAAIKIARRFNGRREILTFHGAFHGRTFGAMSAAGSTWVKRGFGPLLTGFLQAPYAYCYRCVFDKEYPSCDLHCVHYLDWVMVTESADDLSAVIVEPYLGAGGQIVPPDDYMQAIAEFSRQHDSLLILDEIQSGFGRAGSMFAFEGSGVVPDLLCLSKGIGSGIPISAVVGRSQIMDVLEAGSISSTFSGNPLSCAAALATIRVIQSEDLCGKSRETGEYMLRRLKGMQARHQLIGDVRGIGLAIGAELVEDRSTKEPAPDRALRIAQLAFEKGVLMNPPRAVFNNVLRITPPLTISRDLVDRALEIIEEAITEVEG